MDENHTEASLSFPTFPRFCGQTFLEHGERDLGLACVQAYNDWMIDEWCAGAGHGRLIPLTLIPLWDPELAAAEVRRCAAKGSFAVAFSENPVRLKLPSIFTDHWDPFFAACEESDTVVNLHIGSSSTFPMTSLDAPRAVSLALTYQGAAHALSDWLTSGVLDRFPRLKVALSEGQVGWIPFIVERLDSVWHDRPVYGNLEDRLTKPPSAYIPGGSTAACSTTPSVSSSVTRSASSRSCSRPTTPTATPRGRTPVPSPRSSSPRPASTSGRPTS